VSGVAQSVQPKGCADCLWPALPRVQELLASALGEVTNGSLGDAILEVSVDPTKGELLALGFACLMEETVGEASVVAVVVGDANAVFGGEAVEGSLCVDGFLAGEVACHQINELETEIMIHKNGGIPIARLGEYPLRLAIEIWLC